MPEALHAVRLFLIFRSQHNETPFSADHNAEAENYTGGSKRRAIERRPNGAAVCQHGDHEAARHNHQRQLRGMPERRCRIDLPNFRNYSRPYIGFSSHTTQHTDEHQPNKNCSTGPDQRDLTCRKLKRRHVIFSPSVFPTCQKPSISLARLDRPGTEVNSLREAAGPDGVILDLGTGKMCRASADT